MSDRKSRYFAVVRLDRRQRIFVIRSPDLPELDEQCGSFDEVPVVARRAIRSQLRDRRRRGRPIPDPTPKSDYEERPEYRDCFLLGVEAGGALRSGGR